MLYAALHFSFRMSRQISPLSATFGWKHGDENRQVGASNGYFGPNDSVSVKESPSYTVPTLPSIDALHSVMSSPAGNAEMPSSPLIISCRSSFPSLRQK